MDQAHETRPNTLQTHGSWFWIFWLIGFWKMITGTTMQAYGEPSYWDERYSQDSGPFDWYQKYNALAPLLHLYIPLHHQVLVVGCGNSGSTSWSSLPLVSSDLSAFFFHFHCFFFMIAAFSEGMVNDGYREVVNIDISSVVVESMQRKYNDRPQLKCIFCKFYECFCFIIVICLFLIGLAWSALRLGLKSNFTYGKCIAFCVQVKQQISRRLSGI